MGLSNPSRETKFSVANGDRKIFIFSVQLAISRIGNLTRLILTIAIYDDHTYAHSTYPALVRLHPSINRHLS